MRQLTSPALSKRELADARQILPSPDPLLRGTVLRFHREFLPLGKVLRVESNQRAVIDAAIASFGRYEEPAHTAQPEVVIRLCIDPKAHDQAPWPVPSFRSLDHIFHIACGAGNFAVADLALGQAIGFVSPQMVEDTGFFRSTFLECLFHVVAVRQSLTPVHAACVARGGEGVLICGESGAGKTTLAYACLKGGMEVVADDVVHLQIVEPSGGLVLWGNPWYLRLVPEAVAHFPELAGPKPKLRSDREWYLEIDVTSRFPGQAATTCRPKAVVVLERTTGGDPALVSLTSSRLLQRLRNDIVLDDPPVLRRHYSVLEKVAQIDSFALKYSGPPENGARVIDKLLRRDS